MATFPAGLDPEGRSRLDVLLARTWSLPPDGHPLFRLQGRVLGAYRLLALVGPKNMVGARYFHLFLADARGRLAKEALALGMHNSGPFPGYNWVELTSYQALLHFDGATLDLAEEGLDRDLFALLSELAPPGGHLMVEYESPSQRDTERLLGLGYPPAATPLGYLLFQAGCLSFRDWYIPEGGREGPRKLQAFKPLNAMVAAEKAGRLRRELSDLLSKPEAPQHGEWGRRARGLARAVLEELGQGSRTAEGGSASG